MLPPWWDVERRETPVAATSDVVAGAADDRVVELPDGVLVLVMSTLPELDVFSELCAPKEHDEMRCPACESPVELNAAGQDFKLGANHRVRNDYGLGWPRAAARTARYVERNGTGAGTPGDDLELWPARLMWDDSKFDACDAGIVGCEGGPDMWSFEHVIGDWGGVPRIGVVTIDMARNRGALRRIAMVMAALRDRQGVGDGVRTARRRNARRRRDAIAGR